MGRLPSWIIVAAVCVLVALAAADAIRPHDEAKPAPRSEPARSGLAVLGGVLVFANEDCAAQALRLPTLVRQRPPHPACAGRVWSVDASLWARCSGGKTEIGSATAEPADVVRGCSPAWRDDGALSVIRDGDLVIVRRHGAPRVFVSRRALATALAGEVPRASKLREVAWLGLMSFAAILDGRQPWQRAILVFSRGGVERFIPEAGQRISDLRASPLGNLAFARNQLGREFVMLSRAGPEIPLPRIANARAIAWSPDEKWVALATRTATFIARTGTRRVVARIHVGGDSLAWLP